jgi:hypothetical protein
MKCEPRALLVTAAEPFQGRLLLAPPARCDQSPTCRSSSVVARSPPPAVRTGQPNEETYYYGMLQRRVGSSSDLRYANHKQAALPFDSMPPKTCQCCVHRGSLELRYIYLFVFQNTTPFQCSCRVGYCCHRHYCILLLVPGLLFDQSAAHTHTRCLAGRYIYIYIYIPVVHKKGPPPVSSLL